MKLKLGDVVEIILNGFKIIPQHFVQNSEIGDADYLRGLHIDEQEKIIYINTSQSAEDMRETILHELYHGKLRLNRMEQNEGFVKSLTQRHYKELYK